MTKATRFKKCASGFAALILASVPLAAQTQEAPPLPPAKVRILPLKKTTSEKNVKLIGESRPFASVTIFAMCSGLVSEVLVDKGDKVKKGQVLATIDAPEIEKQYAAMLAETQYKKTISVRSNTLRGKKLISSQEADQADSDYKISKAKLESLEIQRACEKVRAPFDGTITNRFVDAGALVQNGVISPSAQPVLAISQVEKLRIYAYVSQKDASFVFVGTPVSISVPEKPGVDIKATVSRMTGELDAKSKTLLVEVDVENGSGAILAGGYVNLSFKLQVPSFIQVPAELLITKGDKTMIPVLNAENKIEMRAVTVFDNDGRQLTISSGLKEGEVVAIATGKELNDGDKVVPIIPTVDAKPGDKKAAGQDQPPAVRTPTGDKAPAANPMGSLK